MLAAMTASHPERGLVPPLARSDGLRFVRLAESGVAGICVGNVHGDLLEANDLFLGLIGFSRDEFDAGLVKWSDRTPPEWTAAHHSALDSLKRTGVAAPWEAELVHKDGHRIPVFMGVGTLDYPNTVTLVTDIAPIRLGHDRLRRTEERLRHAQKMEALGALAGGMAHEFNNLLSVILGHAGMLAGDLAPGDPMREVLEEIRTAGERAALLTRQLLTFSRHQPAHTAAVDLTDVVNGARQELRDIVGDAVELAFDTARWLPNVLSDADHLRQALVELVRNARDAMPNGGRVTIETAALGIRGGDWSAEAPLDLAAGDYATLAVADTGAGMDRVTQARMFEPFFTTKGVGNGTGLGLSTVFGIVQQSGGSIRTETKLGQGTTVRLFFPAAYSSASGANEDIAPTSLDGTETILIVDDEEGLRSNAAVALRQHGYTVLEAAGAADAMHLAQAHPSRIHLLVADVTLMRSTGREIFDRLRHVHPELRVLYTSGYTTSAVVRHGVIGRDARFVQKPFTPAGLLASVRRALDSAAPPDPRAAHS
jgi:signal transduction histidine kinase/ActR/RegA family two-component response regulator